jgi:molybdate transport system substrate-binding protein
MRAALMRSVHRRFKLSRHSRACRVTAGLLVLAAGATAQAAELQVLSAGAIEPGLKAATAAFEKETGHSVKITFNTAPALRKRMEGSANVDVVIAPPTLIGEFATAGKVDGSTRGNVGRVGMGVAVRDGAPVPDISTSDALKKSVTEADSIVFNKASTGLYFEELLKKWGLYAQVEGKTSRYPDGAAVMEHVMKGKGREIGFGAMTEILLYQGKGLTLVGPVPADVQNYTSYTAAPLTASTQPALAKQFVGFLAGPAGKPLFNAAGVVE